jgi:hypothetical protein
VREGGVVTSQAVLIAIGVDWDGRRQILAVEMANRESRSSWKDFLLGLRRRGLNGVEFVVADDHAVLRMAIREVLPEAAFQRCYVHFLRNAMWREAGFGVERLAKMDPSVARRSLRALRCGQVLNRARAGRRETRRRRRLADLPARAGQARATIASA